MAYAGAWRSRQRYTPPAGDNPNLGAGVQDDHLHPSEPMILTEPTPSLPAAPDYLYTHDDYMIPPVLVTDPVISEPLGHQYGTVAQGTEQSPQEARVEAYHAHMADYGAGAVHHHADRIERADADTYITQRVEQEFPQTGSRAALTRGRNAWAENNPDGPPPQGHMTMRWIDRQYTRRRISPDQAPLRPYRAATAAQSPAPADGDGHVYMSPFARLGNARSRKMSTPQLRRVPRGPDEDVIGDGTTDPQYDDPSYWDGW